MKKILAVLVLLIAIYIGYQFMDHFDPGNLFYADFLHTKTRHHYVVCVDGHCTMNY